MLAADIDFVRDDISKNASSETEFVIAFDQLYQIDNNHYNEYEKNLKKTCIDSECLSVAMASVSHLSRRA